MNKIKGVTTATLATLLIAFSLSGCANDKQGGPKGKNPPPEAIAACVEKNKGDKVTFKGRRGETLEATCQEVNDHLVAVPEGMPDQKKLSKK